MVCLTETQRSKAWVFECDFCMHRFPFLYEGILLTNVRVIYEENIHSGIS